MALGSDPRLFWIQDQSLDLYGFGISSNTDMSKILLKNVKINMSLWSVPGPVWMQSVSIYVSVWSKIHLEISLFFS